MAHLRLGRIGKGWLLALGLSGLFLSPASSAPVVFSDIEATTYVGKRHVLLRAIDGVDAGRDGWSVYPQVSVPQSGVFIFKEPVTAGRLRLTLCFLSGIPNAHFNEFALFVTSDTVPSLNGSWEALAPWQIYSTGTRLQVMPKQIIRSNGPALNTEFLVESLIAPKPVTGIRIDVLPVSEPPGSKEPFLATSANHDFVLTELRVEAFDTETTNVALGAPVRASHAIWGPFRPEFLTDGLAATFAHPRDPNLGDQFFYEIDLGKVRTLDHISLRGRGDMLPERLSKVHLHLYSEPTDADIEPNWDGIYRGDGSYPPLGAAEFIHGDAGSGRFEGQYLRISSSSSVALSPQIAEVEVYESVLPELIGLRADDRSVAPSWRLAIEPGIRWLAFNLRPAQKHLPKKVPIRWRFKEANGASTPWAKTNAEGIAEGACPPPGAYIFEAQIGHTDGQWNVESLQIPIAIAKPWWREPFIQLAGLITGVGFSIWGIRYFTRRQLESQLLQLEHIHALDEERARIARDMHDVVGARLTQLSVMHDIFAKQHPLTDAATLNLKQLSGTAREAIAALDEVVWTVNPRNDSLSNLADYICHCATEYLAPLEIACLQEVASDLPALQVGAQVRHEIVLAFKEALQNVVKHAEATEVTLTLSYVEGVFLVQVDDNGKGLPRDILGKEKDGLSNMVTRISKVGGTCEVTPGNTVGTSVLMRVPL
ncbi:MAG: histidine kinase [Verrucomicrobiota bacterium]